MERMLTGRIEYKMWRERSPSGKWRWLIFDVDFTFGGNAGSLYDTNTLELGNCCKFYLWSKPALVNFNVKKDA
jgi:hypothetical protein